jgi:hypothetical protein
LFDVHTARRGSLFFFKVVCFSPDWRVGFTILN